MDAVEIPKHAEVIASHDGELVAATPAWVGKLEDAKHSAIFVDARTWPPAITRFDHHVAAAARGPDGRWVVVEQVDTAWRFAWYADIRSSAPTRVEPVPQVFLDGPPEAFANGQAPIAQLEICGGLAIAVPLRDNDVHVHVHRGDAWVAEPVFPLGPSTLSCGDELVSWAGLIFQRRGAAFHAVTEIDEVRRLVQVGDTCFGIFEDQLVALSPTLLTPRLPGHDIVRLQRAPRGQLLGHLMTDTADGVAIEPILYDPVDETAVSLAPILAGAELAGFTADGTLIAKDKTEDDVHRLVPRDLADAPRVAASSLPPSEKIAVAAFDDVGAASRPQIATLGDHIMIAVENVVRVFELDTPRVIVELAEPIVGLVAGGDHVVALGANGTMWSIDQTGTITDETSLAVKPRALAPIGDRGFAILAESGVHVVVAGKVTTVIPIARPIAAAADDGDGIVIAAEGKWLAHWTGTELRDLPPTSEQIVAIASLGDRRFVCAGNYHLYTLDLREPELVSLETRVRAPFIATNPATGDIAYCESPKHVAIHTIDNGALVDNWRGGVIYSVYIQPAGDVTLHGFAFTKDGSLVIAIDDGHANLVAPRAAGVRKLDPHAGVTDRQWLFICGGEILM